MMHIFQITVITLGSLHMAGLCLRYVNSIRLALWLLFPPSAEAQTFWVQWRIQSESVSDSGAPTSFPVRPPEHVHIRARARATCVRARRLKCVTEKLPPLQFHHISLSSAGQGDREGTAVYLLTDQSLSSRSAPRVNAEGGRAAPPPPWTNTIGIKNEKHYCRWRLYLRLFNSTFLSRRPRGIYPSGKPFSLRACSLAMYILLPEGKRRFYTVS